MDFDKIVNFRPNWKTYGFDVALLTVLGWLILVLANFLSEQKFFQIPDFIKTSPDLIMATTFFAFLVLFFALIKMAINSLLMRIKSNKTYKFSFDKWQEDWIFNGKTAPENISDLRIEFSRAGCLLNNFFWKDFRMSFEAKYIHANKSFGIIFRAKDLNNYFMIEIANATINSRVRFSSGWEEVENFSHSIELVDFFKVVLEVKEGIAWLHISDKLAYSWVLPNYIDVNHWEAGVNQNTNGGRQTGEVEKKPLQEHVQKIHFKDQPGKIGFRAHSGQGATIRGLTVKPL